MNYINPKDWKVPVWHPDFGNPNQEFEMLQAFSVKAMETCSDLASCFVVYESGYMAVKFLWESNDIGELQIVEGKTVQRYGLFMRYDEKDEGEYYFSNIDEGIKKLLECL